MPAAQNTRIVVLDGFALNPGDLSWEPLEHCGDLQIFPRTDGSLFLERASAADILVTNKVPINSAHLQQLPRLRFIAVTATGYNVVDAAAARARGIPVSNVPEYGSNTVAEFTLALILELTRGVGRHAQSVAQGEWQRSSDWCYWLSPQIELAGKTIGIVGYGRIGRRVGELANALGMNVIATDNKSIAPPFPRFRQASLHELFAEADIVSLHCPQTDSNKQMVNDELIRRMKPHALLINASRGGLVDEAALSEHLNRGTIAGAAVDVVSAEPIAGSNPLLKTKNCLITPHQAWTTSEARSRIISTTAQNITGFLAGKPQNVVNV